MSYLTRFSREFPWFGNLPNWMDDFFEGESLKGAELTVPAVNVLEAIKHFTLEMAVPGMVKSDFKISVNDHVMTISSESKSEIKEDEKGKIKRREYNYAKFSRSFTLPSNTDVSKIGASYENGILSIHIPKMELELSSKGKQIQID